MNTIGSQNTFIGTGAGVSASNPGLQNATAIGYNASVTVSNALILGNGVNVGIGTTALANKLEITQGTAGNQWSTVDESDERFAGQCVEPDQVSDRRCGWGCDSGQ